MEAGANRSPATRCLLTTHPRMRVAPSSNHGRTPGPEPGNGGSNPSGAARNIRGLQTEVTSSLERTITLWSPIAPSLIRTAS